MDIKKIKTGITALYEKNLISYSPSIDHVEMLFGTNTKKYTHYKITLQKDDTFAIGIEEINGEYYYCAERLFIELNKFKLEQTIKTEAINNLIKVIDPEKTKRIYELIKSKRRGLDNEFIIKYLDKHLLYIKDKLKASKDVKTLLREYIMALVSKQNIPVSLIKGGSSIELFTSINRSTLDIDAHTDKDSIKDIVTYLFNKNKDVYFKISLLEATKLQEYITNSNKITRVLKLNLLPVSRGGVLKDKLKDIHIPISFNTTYNKEQLNDIIKTYKITHRKLKHLSNASCIVFTREMLLAEKFQSLISEPAISTRTKDLIDLKLLWSKNINFNDFRKWLFRKWENQSDNQSKKEAINIIIKNQNIPLIKIKNNFEDSVSMYSLQLTYDECIKLYNILIKESII